ncbi:GrpB family protein [Clostridium estertheticum]|uniref:GrpB family protein n=1 Tax=Clostridium estertheticum TaxID=238834 RepID=UPI001CF57483|nr:GrpB family protein [Clostridium estertheticum]MCB2306631.1 GrpB family protein [Clostridium estertheticum]MCB2345219.1 GrpB family protein [Clostridium estertheticum]MCB2350007.1 GrpB family protein [Clostridium estertheticum]WAG44397.1 GrpB family protein [Clostridium estertheticum]
MGKELSEMALKELWELFPIILKKHNIDYKEWYETEKQKLLRCIDKKDIRRINHIGSSAVEGLIAKPTVDILLEIDNESNIEQLRDALLHNGWLLMSFENKPCMKMVFNKGYTKEGFAEKVYHLHVRYYDNWNELYFRDYLIEHDEVAKAYGELKLELIEKYEHDRDGYTNAKTNFILKYTEKAKEEYVDKYNPRNNHNLR